MFSSLAYRKGTCISPILDHNDSSSSTFQGHTNRCIAGGYKRGHVLGPNARSGVSRSLTYGVLRLLPAIQETAQVTGAAFLLGLERTQSAAYPRSLWSRADVKQSPPTFHRSGFQSQTPDAARLCPQHHHCPRTFPDRTYWNGL